MCRERQYLNDDDEESKVRILCPFVLLVNVGWRQVETLESEGVVVMGSDMLEVCSTVGMISIFEAFSVRWTAGGLHYVEVLLMFEWLREKRVM